jgi:hypothetical protein
LRYEQGHAAGKVAKMRGAPKVKRFPPRPRQSRQVAEERQQVKAQYRVGEEGRQDERLAAMA